MIFTKEKQKGENLFSGIPGVFKGAVRGSNEPDLAWGAEKPCVVEGAITPFWPVSPPEILAVSWLGGEAPPPTLGLTSSGLKTKGLM